ncbi:hypothetical protein F4778DRAFT_784956 [Xylariomycetidae sp. FL2044]|nr:hypothetical protein F4778DRAFT_784956 [Xylariomycetidae sp. FL2044]
MKLFTIPLLALALQATAEPRLEIRQDAAVQSLLDSVNHGMQNLDHAILAYKGGPPFALREAAHSLIKTVKEQTEVAKGLGSISIEDVKLLAGASKATSATGDKFLKDLAGAKPVFEKAGICVYLFEYTVKLAEVSNVLFNALGTKFPPVVQPHAADDVKHTNELFAQAKQALGPGSCIDRCRAPHFPPGHGGGDHGHKTTSVAWHTKPTGVPHHGGAGDGKNGTHDSPFVHEGGAGGSWDALKKAVVQMAVIGLAVGLEICFV